MKLQNAAYFFICAISLVIILINGHSILIPLVMGLLLWFVVRKVKSTLDRIPFIKQNFPSWLKSIVASILIFTLVSMAANVLSYNINLLATSYEKYQSNLTMIVEQINLILHIDLIEMMKEQSVNLDFGVILGGIFNALSYMLGNAFMIVLYSLFVMFEEANFAAKLKILFSEEQQYLRFRKILERIEKSVSNYLGLKTLVSLITGVLSYVILWFIGIDSPIFWAFLIFVLNFIPTIGSLVGTIFPAIFCLLQFGAFTPAFLVLGLVGVVQLLVGNILEPRLMGSSMNISSLVALIALAFWGLIWGITGMILSIPITVIMVIMLSQVERTRPIAIMLSEKGQIEGLA